MELSQKAFVEATLEKSTGLTHAALVGARKQSVRDAEKLLSYPVAKFMQNTGHQVEAEYVSRIAGWHEASDGRGLSQLQRSKQNYAMLNYLLNEWMPWHAENPDFTFVDINRYPIKLACTLHRHLTYTK